tara:strand:- start:687 stop:1352 length:666 start_codon:yes stop_codon:yes gene_type:complete
MLGVYGTGNTETQQTDGMFQGLTNFLAAGGSLDEYMVRAFPQTAGLKNMKRFSAIPKSMLKNPAALRTGASKIAMMGSRRIPIAGGLLQAATGDPIGGAGTAIGGVVGGVLGAPFGPLGIAVGSTLGAGLGQTGTRALAGIDINDPYSGPDLSIPIFGGIPITPYAKTKRKKERAREELGKDMAALEPYLQKQMGREMAAQQQIVSGNLMNTALANARFGR